MHPSQNFSKPVDIIIPVYNGCDLLKKCLNSILKNTLKNTYRIIIIDDCGKDQKTRNFLKTLEKREDSSIIILKNKQNLGFVLSVNKGMGFSKENDVVLLNSDTIVTKNWLKKLRDCAYSRKNIATVTPITNNGMLVSFPLRFQANSLIKGFSLDQIAHGFERASLKLYPEIPSPVGFCLFIKRIILQKTGFFDPIYGKGYGEENDFGMKAYRLGYRHVLADNTFIYHQGSATFDKIKKEKRVLIKKNTQILHQRFKELDGLLKTFEKHNPLLKIYNHFKVYFATNQFKKKGILFVYVNDLSDSLSGATFHVQYLTQNLDLTQEFNPYLLFIQNNILNFILINQEFGNIHYCYKLKKEFSLTQFNHQEIEAFFKTILESFNINVVHFQGMQFLPLKLFYSAKKSGKKVLFTAHDFFLYCPAFILVNQKGQFCNYETNEKKCFLCLKNKFNKDFNQFIPNFQKSRRQFITKRVIPYIDQFIFPSFFLKNKLLKIFPTIQEKKISVLEHGVKQKAKKDSIQINKKASLNIAFLGTFHPIKGAYIFQNLIKIIKDPYFHFFLIGKQKTYLKKTKNLTIIGSFLNSELANILNREKIDLVLILSVCPETYSFTLSEAWQNKLPVVVLDLGAQSERIKKTGAGFIVNPKNPLKEIKTILEKIKQNPNILQEKIKKIPKLKSAVENAIEYQKIYQKILTKTGISKTEPIKTTDLILKNKKMFTFLDNPKKDHFSFEASALKHHVFLFFDKLGLAHTIRPYYNRYQKKVEKIINQLIDFFKRKLW